MSSVSCSERIIHEYITDRSKIFGECFTVFGFFFTVTGVLQKNNITILSNKNQRGWEIRLESEKLYYFTISILDEYKRKTLPIPSGKCSILIDKL